MATRQFLGAAGLALMLAAGPAKAQPAQAEDQPATGTQAVAPRPELLFRAIDLDDPDAVRAYLILGGDMRARRADGATALHAAVRQRNVQIVDVLLEGGTDPNATDADGNTPLHLAAERDATIVGLLLERGADREALNRLGRSPMRMADRAGITEAMHLLSGSTLTAEQRDRVARWRLGAERREAEERSRSMRQTLNGSSSRQVLPGMPIYGSAYDTFIGDYGRAYGGHYNWRGTQPRHIGDYGNESVIGQRLRRGQSIR